MPPLLKFLVLFYLFFWNSKVFAQNKFVILGSLPSNHGEVELNLAFDNSRFPHLTASSKNGKFNFSGEIKDEFEYVRLILKTKNGRDLGGCSFFIKSGNLKIIIEQFDEDNNNQFKVKYFNIPFIKEQNEYADLIEPISDSIAALSRLMVVNKKILKKYDSDSLQRNYDLLRQERTNVILQLATQKYVNYWGLYIFNREIIERMVLGRGLNLDTLLLLYNGFDTSLKNTQLGKSVGIYLRRRQSLLIGNTIPNFSFLTNDGRRLDLASFHGNKYVLLCFWSTGCVPCIKGFPLLNELATEYEAKGLQLISVSSDYEESIWLNSLKRYELNWLHTCDLPKYNNDKSITDLYDVKYIPQYFLIDKEGKLIYHNSQSNDTVDYNILRMKLNSLLN